MENLAQKTDFDSALERAHKFKDYKTHFKGLYMALRVSGYILLTISAFLSSRFFSALLESNLGDASPYAGFIISVCISALIGKITGDLLVYWEAHGIIEPTLGVFLLLLIAGNGYFDWSGGNEWAYDLTGERPQNTESADISGTYTAQVASIDGQINDIEAKEFYWCGTHNKAHKCPSAGFYIDPKKDRKAVAEIETLKAQRAELVSSMDAQLATASQEHAKLSAEYDDRLSGTKTITKGGSIVCMLLYSFVAFWCHKYGVRAVSEISQTNPSPIKTYTAEEIAEAEKALAREARENRELREELASLREAEKRGAIPQDTTADAGK